MTMDGAPHNFQLLEPPSPEALVPDSPIETWMISAAVAALVLLALLAFLFLRKKNQTSVDPSAVRNAARVEATQSLFPRHPLREGVHHLLRSGFVIGLSDVRELLAGTDHHPVVADFMLAAGVLVVLPGNVGQHVTRMAFQRRGVQWRPHHRGAVCDHRLEQVFLAAELVVERLL